MTQIQVPEHKTGDGSRDRVKSFSFDHCYWTVDRNDPKYASQEQVTYRNILEHL